VSLLLKETVRISK